MRLLLIISMLLIPIALKSTCIIIIRINDKVYIASDSRRRISKNTPKGVKIMYDTITKVHEMNKCVFAIAGHFDKQLYEMATSSIRKIGVFDKAVKAFEDNMKISYSELMGSEKIHNRNSYLGYLNNRLGSVAFITFINGQLKLEILDFSLEEDKLGRPRIKCSRRKSDDKQTLEVLGESYHIDRLSDAQYDMLYNRFISQPDLLAAEFVSLEVGYHKESIAKPIDRFLLTCYGLQILSPKRKTNVKNPYRY